MLEPGEVRWEKSSRHDTSFAEEDLLVFETDIDLLLEVKGFGENVRALKRADKAILGIDHRLVERDLQACTAGINLRGFCIRAGSCAKIFSHSSGLSFVH